eukprot:7742695-Alexandrium_andersonii.AAC.1
MCIRDRPKGLAIFANQQTPAPRRAQGGEGRAVPHHVVQARDYRRAAVGAPQVVRHVPELNDGASGPGPDTAGRLHPRAGSSLPRQATVDA